MFLHAPSPPGEIHVAMAEMLVATFLGDENNVLVPHSSTFQRRFFKIFDEHPRHFYMEVPRHPCIISNVIVITLTFQC